MADPVLSLAEAEALVARALMRSGTGPPNAASVARALVRAEADGQKGHGLSRVPSYAAQSLCGKVRGEAVPAFAELAPAAFRVDAGAGFAYPAIDLALPELTARARTQGIACAVIVHSHHFGVAGHPCEALAEAGLAGFVWGNSPKAMAPWGAKTAILGTNPIAFAAPLPGRPPLVIDLATSAVARGRILAAREAGQPIPEGWALDADGHPTTDPAAALRGSMAPLGGPKGAAIALLVEVMAACLTGMSLGPEASSLLDAEGPPPDLGQSLVAVDVERLSGGAFGARIARLALFYAEAGARFPGERRLAARARAEREGLTVPAPLLGKIREIAGT